MQIIPIGIGHFTDSKTLREISYNSYSLEKNFFEIENFNQLMKSFNFFANQLCRIPNSKNVSTIFLKKNEIE